MHVCIWYFDAPLLCPSKWRLCKLLPCTYSVGHRPRSAWCMSYACGAEEGVKPSLSVGCTVILCTCTCRSMYRVTHQSFYVSLPYNVKQTLAVCTPQPYGCSIVVISCGCLAFRIHQSPIICRWDLSWLVKEPYSKWMSLTLTFMDSWYIYW